MLPVAVTQGICILCGKPLSTTIPGLKITKGETNIIFCWRDYNAIRDITKVFGPMFPTGVDRKGEE